MEEPYQYDDELNQHCEEPDQWSEEPAEYNEDRFDEEPDNESFRDNCFGDGTQQQIQNDENWDFESGFKTMTFTETIGLKILKR